MVLPGIVDFSTQADEAFQRFADAGMHIVQSSQAIAEFLDSAFVV